MGLSVLPATVVPTRTGLAFAATSSPLAGETRKDALMDPKKRKITEIAKIFLTYFFL